MPTYDETRGAVGSICIWPDAQWHLHPSILLSIKAPGGICVFTMLFLLWTMMMTIACSVAGRLEH